MRSHSSYDFRAQFLLELGDWDRIGRSHQHCPDNGAAVRPRSRDRRGFGDLRVFSENALDLDWADVMPRSNDHVVFASEETPASTRIDLRPVLGDEEITVPSRLPGFRPVLIVDRHLIARLPYGNQAAFAFRDWLARSIYELRIETWHRPGEGTGLGCGGRDEIRKNHAYLAKTVTVADRGCAGTMPLRSSLGVQRFAGSRGADQATWHPTACGDLYEPTVSTWRGGEAGDLFLTNYPPPSRGVEVAAVHDPRHAEGHRCCAGGVKPVRPSRIGRGEEQLLRRYAEGVTSEGEDRKQARVRHNTRLRFARGSTREQQSRRVKRVCACRSVGVCTVQLSPEAPVALHQANATRADNGDYFDLFVEVIQRAGELVAPLMSDDDKPCSRGAKPIGQCISAERAEQWNVNEPRAPGSESGDPALDLTRQDGRYAMPWAQAGAGENARQLRRSLVEFAVGPPFTGAVRVTHDERELPPVMREPAAHLLCCIELDGRVGRQSGLDLSPDDFGGGEVTHVRTFLPAAAAVEVSLRSNSDGIAVTPIVPHKRLCSNLLGSIGPINPCITFDYRGHCLSGHRQEIGPIGTICFMTEKVSARQPVDRVTLVTGGARGIGAAITRTLAARGHNVGCTYRVNKAHVDKLAANTGGRVLPVPYELGDGYSASLAVSTTVEHWGRLDGLIVNAGQWHGGKLSTMDSVQWWSVIETNLKGMAQLVRAALPALAEGVSPAIVLVSSVVGVIGHAGDTAYASAKSAMIGFGRSLAKEVGRDGIRVNILAPGFIEIDMTAAVPESSRRNIEQATILGRFGTPEEIAQAAAFLCDDATYCTGMVLAADGGWSI